MSGAKIILENIHKRYGSGETSVDAIRGISLVIEAGEFVAVVGSSGSGKSTLLHIIGALDRPTSGRLFVDGKDISKMDDTDAAKFRNETVGFVFQNFYLQMHLTAIENVELPLLIRGVSPDKRRKLAKAALDAVGLSERILHRPNQLSGGECQRVAIARAMVTEPKILLADEPTGNLDTARGMEIMRIIERLNKERLMTTIVVTHDSAVAAIARRRIYLCDGVIVREEYAGV